MRRECGALGRGPHRHDDHSCRIVFQKADSSHFILDFRCFEIGACGNMLYDPGARTSVQLRAPRTSRDVEESYREASTA